MISTWLVPTNLDFLAKVGSARMSTVGPLGSDPGLLCLRCSLGRKPNALRGPVEGNGATAVNPALQRSVWARGGWSSVPGLSETVPSCVCVSEGRWVCARVTMGMSVDFVQFGQIKTSSRSSWFRHRPDALRSEMAILCSGRPGEGGAEAWDGPCTRGGAQWWRRSCCGPSPGKVHCICGHSRSGGPYQLPRCPDAAPGVRASRLGLRGVGSAAGLGRGWRGAFLQWLVRRKSGWPSSGVQRGSGLIGPVASFTFLFVPPLPLTGCFEGGGGRRPVGILLTVPPSPELRTLERISYVHSCS